MTAAYGSPAMTGTELAEALARRSEVIAAVVARHQGAEAVTAMDGKVCASSGYCGCSCKPCLGGIHRCGHSKGCHKGCRSLL